METAYKYEKLPLVDLSAPRVLSRRSRIGSDNPDEAFSQDIEDALRILKLADLEVNLCRENIIDAKEKYMVEIRPVSDTESSLDVFSMNLRQKGIRKPHYTRLLLFSDKLIFYSACCLPLQIIAASLDGKTVSGRILFTSHSEQEGGKLVYEFIGKGSEIMLDLRRGKSTKAQRIVFDLASFVAIEAISRKT
ncbi:MAG: hypothetical protein ACUBOA_15510 [Candidatus Loosdrechtia sp.]|uniref:hypothetical protein n=1 Tax=Candidatus Loosdrechtia sp. TaxID=3101272 RepID=UPI003A6FD99C|nr:MAG: hypothetical protein QY305_10780 [Candidatus Jettenia sp. AMX2]